MSFNIKDNSCDEEHTSVPDTSKVSRNDTFTNSEIGSSENSSTTLTDPLANNSNDFKFANRTPGTLFNHSRQNSTLISYKSLEKNRTTFNGMLTDSSEKREGGVLYKIELNRDNNNMLGETIDLHRPIQNQDAGRSIGVESLHGNRDTNITGAIYKPICTTSLVKFGSSDTALPMKDTKMGISKSYFILINELENKCNELEVKLLDGNKEIKVKNDELMVNKNKLRDVAKMTENLKKTMLVFQENLDLLQNEKMQYTKTLKSLRDENMSTKSRIRTLRHEINESIRKMDLYKSKFSKFKFRLESQNLKIISLNSTVDELSGNLSEEKLKTSSLIQEITQINQTHSEQMTQLQSQLQNTLLDKLNNSLPAFIKDENNLIQDTLLRINKDVLEKLNLDFSHLKNDFKNCNDFNNTKYENNFHTLSSQLTSINDYLFGMLDPLFKQMENRGEVIFSSLKEDILLPNFAAILKKSDVYFNKIENNLNDVNNAMDQSASIGQDYNERFAKVELHVSDLVNSRQEFMDKYQKLQFENVKLDKNISILEAKESEVSQKLINTKESLVSLQRCLDDSNSEIQILKQQSQAEKEHYCKNYESQIQTYKQLNSITMDEKSRMKSEIDNLLVKVTELEKCKLDFDKVQKKNHSLILKVENSTSELNKLHEEKQLVQNDMLNQHSKFIEKVNFLNKELAITRDVLEKLEEYKVKLKDKEERLAVEKQIVSIEKTKALSLENKVSELEKTIKEITRKIKIEETKFNNSSIALKSMYEDTKKELVAERIKIKKLDENEKEKIKAIDDLRLKYQQQVALNDEMINSNKQERSRLENTESILKESEKKRSSLMKENEELNFKINELQSQLLKINPDNTLSIKKRKLIDAEKLPEDEYSFDNINSSTLEAKNKKPNSRRQKPRR